MTTTYNLIIIDKQSGISTVLPVSTKRKTKSSLIKNIVAVGAEIEAYLTENSPATLEGEWEWVAARKVIKLDDRIEIGFSAQK